jgi:hypothetical protein
MERRRFGPTATEIPDDDHGRVCDPVSVFGNGDRWQLQRPTMPAGTDSKTND